MEKERRRGLLSKNAKPLPEYTYTGNAQFIDDGGGNWRIKFLSGGTFTLLNDDYDVDIFLVGGGGAPAAWGPNGGGGGGGYTNTVRNISLTKGTNYPVTVGTGGLYTANTAEKRSGGVSSFNTYTANGGKYGHTTSSRGGDGGSGGGGSYGGAGGSDGLSGARGTDRSGGIGQQTTTREFGETTGELYAGGGGGGGEGSSSNSDTVGGAGGAGGGGQGGKGGYYGNGQSGTSGTPNTGGGGGQGGRGYYSNSTNGQGGNGGSGIVIIRNARG